jgi:acetyl esterase/lipase
MPLDRRADRLLAMLAATQGALEARETPVARRQALRRLAEMADDAGAPVEVRDLSCPGPGGEIGLRLYAPPGAVEAVLPGLLFFHGGGWVAGDFATHDGLCRRLALAAGCRIIAVDYRRAPEHPFPAAFDDALAAAKWVAAHASQLHVDADRLAVGGDSIGGGLAAAVALAARDVGAPRLALQVLICPIVDAGGDSDSREAFADGYFISRAAFARDLAAYLPAASDADDPRVSPLLAADVARLPPAIVHTAEFDPFRDEAEAYAERLRSAGARVRCERHAGQIHYFYAMAQAIPAAHAAAALIGKQMREAFDATAVTA